MSVSFIKLSVACLLLLGVALIFVSGDAEAVDPSWTKRNIDTSFGGATSVYAIDIDGDGDLDILGAADTANDITWWENDGTPSNGGWTEHTIDGSFNTARDVYAIDLDGDGDIDVLGASSGSDEITWWENDGSQSFTEHTIDGDFLSAYAVYAIDVDGDGDIDVLGAANGNDVDYDITWWENDGSESFTAHTIDSTFAKARDVYAIDMDGDGDIDVLGASYGDNDINWWENDGSESFTQHAIATSFVNANSVYAIDIDNDGDIDVLGMARGDDEVTWWENDGSQSFTEHTIDSNFDHAYSVYAIDMDNDGDVDILGSARRDDDVTWWENDGSGSFTEHTIDANFNGAEGIYPADIDGDGDMDVVGVANEADDIVWWENTATFSFDPTWTTLSVNTDADGAEDIFVADIDGDGDLDIVAALNRDNQVAWYENDGDPFDGGWTHHIIKDYTDPCDSCGGMEAVFVADIDNDGDLDVISANGGDDVVEWYENNGDGSSWTKHDIVSGEDDADGASAVFAADIDNDGDMDIVAAFFMISKVAWYENDGSPANGGWTTHNVNTPDNANGAEDIFVADMDNDGDLDIVEADQTSNKVYWYENDGSPGDGTWTRTKIKGGLDAVYSVFVADMDNDGDMDVVTAVYVDDDVRWHENDGTPSGENWNTYNIGTLVNGAVSVFVADMDNDGDMDVVSAAAIGDKIQWHENDGTPDAGWTTVNVETSVNKASSVFVADIDNDGYMDIVSAAYLDDEIAWYDNGGGGTDDDSEPIWSYETDDDVLSVSVSDDGEYIAAGGVNYVYLFDKDSSTPLWSYMTGGANSVSISADGEYIAAGSEDHKVYLFDKDSSTPLWSYSTGGEVHSVAISADGEYIVAGSNDDKVYLFDMDSSTPLWSYTTGHDVYSVAISADGEYIAVGTYDNKVYLFDKDSSTPLWSYATGDYVVSVAISADGEYITAGSWDNKVYLFDKDSSTPLWFYYTGNVVVVSVDISADGQYIVAGSGDDRVYLFDKGSSDPLWNYETNDDVQSVAISADGEYIAVGSEDDKVYLFDKDSSTPLWSYTAGDWVNTVAISADGKYVATGSQDDSVYAFKNSLADRPSIIPYGPRSGSDDVVDPILRWFAGSDDRSNLTFDVYLDTNSSPTTLVANDTSNLSYVTSDLAMGTKYYWKVIATDPTGSKTSSVMNFTIPATTTALEWSYDTGSNVYSVAVSADGEYIVASNSEGSKIFLFDKDSSTPLWSYSTESDANSVAISADGEYIVAGSQDDKVYLFDKDSSTPLWSYDAGGNVNSVAISATGKYIVAGTDDKVYLFDKDSSTPLWSYSAPGDVLSVAISADGEYIAAGTNYQYRLFLFAKDSSTPLWSYATADNVRSVAISATGKYIVAGTDDNKVYLFDKENNIPVQIYTTDGDVRSVAISADGAYIVAGSHDDKVYLLDKYSSTPLWSYSTGADVDSVTISADGEYIVAGSGGYDDKTYLFGKDSSTPLWNYTAGNDVKSVAISADGKYLAAGSVDDNVYTFKNFLPSRPSIILYGPRSDTFLEPPTTLRWYAGSDDRSNLTFDVYLDTSSNPTTKVANNITGFSYNVTSLIDRGVKYYWKVVATDPSGSATSSVMNFAVQNDWFYDTETNARSVAVSADGEYIAAGSHDDKVYLFSKDNSTPLWSYTTDDIVDTVAMSADGEYIVSGSYDGEKIYLFERDSSTPLWNYSTGGGVSTVAISADGEYIVAASKGSTSDRKVYLFDKDSSTPLWSYSTSGHVNSIAISLDGEYIAAADEGKVYLFDRDSSTPLWTYGNGAKSVALSADGKYITVSSSTKVYLFGKDSSTPLWTYTGTQSMNSVAISVDGEYIAAGSDDNKVYFFDKDSSTPLWSYTTESNVHSVAISADGEYIVGGAYDTVSLLGRDSGLPLWVYHDEEFDAGGEMSSVALSADGMYIAAASEDHNIYSFKNFFPNRPSVIPYGPRSGSEPTLPVTLRWFGGSEDRSNLTFDVYLDTSSNPTTILASSITGISYTPTNLAMNVTYYWKVTATDPLGNATSHVMNFTYKGPMWSYGTGDSVQSVAVSADGEYIAVGSEDDKFYLFDKDSSTPLWSYATGDNVGSVAISADGEYIAVGSQNKKVYLFDKDSSTPLWNYTTGGNVRSVAISADGAYIAASSMDPGKVYLFNKDSSTPLWSYTIGDCNYFECPVAISADGKYIVAGSDDDKVYLFGKDSSTPLWSYTTGDDVRAIAISADGEYIVAGSGDDDKKVYLFNKDSSTPLWSYTTGNRLVSVTISADGGYITAASTDYKVYLFNKDSSTPLWSYTTGSTVYSVAISADGEYISAGSGDKKVYLFDKDSSTPLWVYETGWYAASVDISADGKYIAVASHDDAIYAFENTFPNRPSIFAYGPRSGSEDVTDPILRWFAGSDDRANLTFDVYLGTSSSPTTLVADDISSLSYTPSGLSNGTKYYWKVVATDPTGSTTSSVMNFTIPATTMTPEWSYEMDDDGLTTATSQDGKYIVVGSMDDHVYLFQSNSSTPIWKYDTGKNVNSVAISADGWSIVAGSDSNDILFWHRNSSTPVWEYDTDSDVILVDITADGNYIVVANEAKRIYYFNTDDDTWDSKKYIWKCEFASGGPELESLSLADNGMSLSVTRAEDLYFFDLEKINRELNGGDESKWNAWSSPDINFISTALSSDGEYVVASLWGGDDGGGDYANPEIRLWNRDSNSYEWKKEIDGNATTLAISANGEYIVAGCDDDKVYLFDKDSSTPLWSYDTGADVTSVSISANGQFILAGQEEGKLFLFNKNSSNPLWNYTNTGGSSFSSVEISKDGDIISATGEDDKVYVFNNNASSSLSVIPYSPIHEEMLYPDDTLRWYWSSNDEDNLVFDVYLGTNSSSLSKVASNLTTSYYQPGNLEVHTYHYWKVVAKDSSGTSTSDVKTLYKRWWWSFHEETNANEYIATISSDGEYIALIDDNIYLFGNDNNIPYWESDFSGFDDNPKVAISSDGEYIVAGTSDDRKTIQFFHKDSSQREWYFDCRYGDNIECGAEDVAISHDGSIIVGVFDDGYLRTWNKDSNVPIYIKDIGTDDTIRDLSMSADGNHIVVSAGESIYLFDGNNNSLWNYEADDTIYSVEISADGEYIITGDDDETIYFFSKESNDPIWDYESDGKVRCVDISSDGEYMVIGTGQIASNYRVYVFDKDSDEPLWEYDPQSNAQSSHCVDISEDGKYISASYNAAYVSGTEVIIWDRTSSTPLWTMSGTGLDNPDGLFILASSASGRYISAAPYRDEIPYYLFENIEASEDFLLPVSPRNGNEVSSPQLIWFAGSDDRSNLTFDVYLGTNASSLTKVADDITTLNYSPSDLAMGTKYYWKVVATDPSGSITSSVMNFTVKVAPEWSYDMGDDVNAVAVSADGEYIAAGGNDDYVYLFDKDSNTPLWSHDIGSDIESISISADGQYIVAGSAGAGKVYLFNKDSSTPVWSYYTGAPVDSVVIDAMGESIAVGSVGYVYLFSVDSSTPIWKYELGDLPYILVDFSADGEYIVTGIGDRQGSCSSCDNRVHLFGKNSSTPIWYYEAGDDIESVAISADGEYIVAGSKDDKVYLFDKDGSTPIWSYSTGGDVRSVSISAGGDYIVSGSSNSKLTLFDKGSSTPLWSYTIDNNVDSVSMTADGKYIVAGTNGGKVYFFDKGSSTPLWSYTTDNNVDSVSISADGKYIVAGSHNGKVYPFKNSLADRPSLLAYGPRNGSNTNTDPQLAWFAGSDDRANLTFDVYLSTSSNPTTKVADDITTFYYNAQCLTLNTKYYWKVVATDGDGSVTSSIMNFTATQYGDIFCVSIDDDYDPAELTIIKGSTVIWTNDDSSLHTVTEDDDEFDSGSISPGNSWSYTFDTVGIYDYYCQYDDDYDGQIIVLVSYPPTATINSISPQIAELDNSVSFSGSGSDPDGTISEYKWTSSIDGDLSTSASFSTIELSFGNHTITFRVKDNDGVWSDNVTSWVDVRKSPIWNNSSPVQIESIAMSADGEYIVVGDYSNDNCVYLYGKNSSTPIWSYQTDSGVTSLSISANGEYIVAGIGPYFSASVILFNKDSSTPLWEYEPGSPVYSVDISADGEYIVAGSQNDKIYLFHKDNSTPVWSYDSYDDVQSVAISADGSLIVAASGNSDPGKIYLFNKDSNTPLWSYQTGGSFGNCRNHCVDISADGEYIVAGSQNGKVYFFDRKNSTPLWNYAVDNSVKSVSISADGEYIAAGDFGNDVFLFDKDSSTPLWTYNTGNRPIVSISADGNYVAAISDKMYLLAKENGNLLWNYNESGGAISISKDGALIAAGSLRGNEQQDDVYLFREDSAIRPFVMNYAPRSGSLIFNETTLRWFPGSDDITNLTFDVYLSWVKSDVLNNNSAAKVADDITNYTHYATSLTESKKYYWKVVATDGTGSVTSKLMNFTVLDTTPPAANITSGPSDPSNSRNATFNFTANEDDVTFQCKMDTDDWHSCSSPKTYTNLLEDTTHQFQIKATDSSNNTGDAVNWIWKISDLTAPVASISSGPSNPSHNQTASFSFSSNEDDSTFQCKLDSGGWSSCSSPKSYSSLTEGDHVFKVKATDEAGNIGSPVTYSWTIDFNIVVDKNGNGDYTSISSALDNATSVNTIKVWAGTYNEDLEIDKMLTLIGNGTTSSIINGTGTSNTDAVKITADWVNLSGFKIQNSGRNGIFIEDSDYVTISGNNVTDSVLEGIYIEDSDYNTIEDNTFTGSEDNGVYVFRSDNNEIDNNTISDNDNSGIELYQSESNTISDNTIKDNGGAGIDLSGSDGNTISNNTIEGTEDSASAGIFVGTSDDNVIKNNTFKDIEGNDIYLSASDSNTISDNTIYHVCDCTDYDGRGIYLTNSDSNTIFNNNINDKGIDGIFLTGSDNNIFINNTIEDNDNGMYITSSSNDNILIGYIDDIYVSSNSDLTIKNYLTILVTLDNGTYNVNNADVLIKDNDNVIHASSGFGGSDPKTDNGTIQTYLITDRIYNANSTATENITTVKILYGTSNISRSVNMSTTHTDSINVDRKSIWVVDVNGSGDFTTIQQAVTVARAGNELRIWSGVYREKIVIDKALTLTGNGSASTKIVGNISQFENTTGILVHLTSDDIVFQKINITLESRGTSSPYFGTLLHIDGDDVTLSKNSFYNYNIAQNVGILVEGDYVNISKNKFYYSELGIYTNYADYGTYSENLFLGDGCSCSTFAILSSSYNRIENNSFYGSNYGLSVHDSSSYNELWFNTLDYSSNGSSGYGHQGLQFSSGSTNNLAYGNQISHYGEGIRLLCTAHSCENNVVENNTVDDSEYGITLYANATNNVIIDNVVRNSESYGIYIQASAHNNTFIDNRVSNSDDYDLFVGANSTGNIFIDSDIGNYSIHSSSSLTLMNYLEIKVQSLIGHPISGADVKIVTSNDTLYSSSHYGGNDAQTNSSGEISEQLLTYRTYDGNTSTNHTTQLYVWYDGIEKVLNLSMNTSRTEVVQLNLIPTSSISSISPQTIYYDNTVTFSGTGSDSDGNITDHEWKSSLDGVISTSANFTISDLSIGNHTIYFKVQDDYDAWSPSATSWVNVVSGTPTATIVSIIPNPVHYGSTASFIGLGSDLDGNITTYRWSSSMDGTLSSSRNFTSDNLSVGNHTIYFKVKDDDNQWSTEVSTWLKVNSYPVANITSITPNPAYRNDLNGTTTYFNSSASDIDGSVTNYYWNSSKDDVLSTLGNFTINVNSLSLGNHTITLRVRDNDGAWSTATSYIMVKSYPNATINSISHMVAHDGTQVTFNGTGSDQDGSITGYHWRSSIDGTLSNSADFSTTDLSVGNHTIYLKVKDNDTLWSTAASSWVRINAYPALVNHSWNSTDILRTSTSVLSISVSDTEDSNSTLSVMAQYRSPSGDWSTGHLSTLTYQFATNLWVTNFTPPGSAELGTYDLRIRVNDTDGASTGWKVYDDEITVSNNDPIVANYNSPSEILRTESSTIYFNTTDVEDSENTHTPSVESRSPMGSWSSTFISTIEYDSDCQCWETDFTPVASAELGYYDLRFKVEDTDDGASGWYTYNNIIEVGNNNPDFVNYTLSSSQTLTTGKIAIGANSTDVEDAEDFHTLDVQYRSPSGSNWSSDYLSELYYDSTLGHWSTNFTPTTTSEIGYYDLRLMVTDTDDGTSNWSTYDDVLFVASNPPELTSYNLLNNDIYRTGTSVILVGVYDIEDSNSSMSIVPEHRSPSGNWSSNYFATAWFNHTSGLWSANFTPTIMAELGEYDVRVKVVDVDGGSSEWSTYLDNVTVRNNYPVFINYTINQSQVLRTESLLIWVDSYDTEDSEYDHGIIVETRSESGDWNTELLTVSGYDYNSDNWKVNFTPMATSELGNYDVRIMVNDTDGDSTDWATFDEVISVFNNNPVLVDHSFNSSVLRTNTIILELNASDIEDPEMSLEVIVNYRSPAGDWADEHLYNPYYNHEIEAWQIVFAPMESAELGSYDFRVTLWDTDGYNWSYNNSAYIFEDATEVVNNLPVIETVESSDFQVKPTESIMVWIGTMDIEDPDDTHNLSIQYLAPSSSEWSDDYFREFAYNGEKWQTEFVPDPEAEMGIYSVRVAVWDLDDDTSGWFVPDDFDIRVVSNEPVIVDSMIQDSMIYRDGTTMIFATVVDIEDSSQDLDLEFQYSVEGGSWENAYFAEPYYEPGLEQWSVEFDPALSAQVGFYEMQVRATDTDGTISDWYSLGSVQVINSPPVITDFELRNHGEDPFSTIFYRYDTGSVSVYVSDSEDSPDQLGVTVSHRFMEEPWEQSFLEEGTYDFSESRWVFNFEIPSFAQEGEYDFSVLAEDLDGEQSQFLEIDNVLFVLNQPPVVLDAQASEYLVNEGSSVTFTGESYDDSFVIEHAWSSDLQGFIGNAPLITVDWLTYGVHNISYQVMDNDNIWSQSYSISIRVNQIPVVEEIILDKYLLHGNESVLAEYLAHDDLGIIAHEWYRDDVLQSFGNVSTDDTPESRQLQLSHLEPGVHILSVRVRDTDDVWSEKFDVEFRVNELPLAEIDSITSTIYNWENPRYVTVDLEGHGIDDMGINSCEWKYEYRDNEIFSLDIPDYNWTVSPSCSQVGLTNFTAGNYTFSLRVNDTDGIWSEWVSHPAFYIDDGDNISFELDIYPLDNTQWFDRDKDGCGDNWKGTNGDAFPQDPTECLDTDGDGIGDNSDMFPTINNTYIYGAVGTMVALIGAALAEFAARRSIPGVLEGLENLLSRGVTDEAINKAIEDLNDPHGSQFFSGDLSDATSLLESYNELTGNAFQSMQELDELKSEVEQMEAEGISSPEISKDISEIEEMIDTEVAGETNTDYLEHLKKEK